jgi:hypothetical protein
MENFCKKLRLFETVKCAILVGWRSVDDAPKKFVDKTLTFKQAGKNGLTKSADGATMEVRRGGSMDLHIDTFTPCLKDTKTGEILPTVHSSATRREMACLKGWNFDWTHPELDQAEIYKLSLQGSTEIQGLVAITDHPRSHAVYVDIAESAPHNLGIGKKYEGVGGHLFAIAAKRSTELGHGGYFFLDAKNTRLVKHYKDTLGAFWLGHPHEYRMEVDETAAQKLLNVYTLEEQSDA